MVLFLKNQRAFSIHGSSLPDSARVRWWLLSSLCSWALPTLQLHFLSSYRRWLTGGCPLLDSPLLENQGLSLTFLDCQPELGAQHPCRWWMWWDVTLDQSWETLECCLSEGVQTPKLICRKITFLARQLKVGASWRQRQMSSLCTCQSRRQQGGYKTWRTALACTLFYFLEIKNFNSIFSLLLDVFLLIFS